MFERQIKLPSAEEVAAEIPLPESLKKLKKERDKLIKEVIGGKSDKLLVIVGPCSAHDSKAVMEYAERLGKLNLEVEDRLALVPRIYTSKPRSKGVGYMGPFFQPDLSQPVDIAKGVRAVRRLNIEAMQASGLTAADEMLYPENIAYTKDLLSYIAVGARSCENPLHRLVASGLNVPVGIKNPMNGSESALINSVFAAQSGQIFALNGWQIKTDGNAFAHAVLRGSVDAEGNDVPNFGTEAVLKVAAAHEKNGLKNPAIIIDCNHSNSGKKFKKQAEIALCVMKNRAQNAEYKAAVKGFMIESFLAEGSGADGKIYGRSVTDPCLGWEDTRRLILQLAETV